MATKTIMLFNPERDQVFQLQVSPEDAIRAEKDTGFATSLLNGAIQEQARESFSVNDEPQLSLNSSSTKVKSTEVIEEADTDDGGNYRWTPECVLLFLETYKTLEEKLNNGKQPQKKIWESVAKILITKDHNVTGQQCSAKLHSLKNTYKDHNNKCGNDRRTWQFYEAMDEIFSKRAWCAPVALASSSGLSTKSGDNSENSERYSSTSEPPTSKGKESIISLLKKRLQQKENHEESKRKRHVERLENNERHHRERLEMDKKLLACLEHLGGQKTINVEF